MSNRPVYVFSYGLASIGNMLVLPDASVASS